MFEDKIKTLTLTHPMDAVGLDDQDESVHSAVKALGDMRFSANHHFILFSSICFLTFILAASWTTLPSLDSPAFVERMSLFPFANSFSSVGTTYGQSVSYSSLRAVHFCGFLWFSYIIITATSRLSTIQLKGLDI